MMLGHASTSTTSEITHLRKRAPKRPFQTSPCPLLHLELLISAKFQLADKLSDVSVKLLPSGSVARCCLSGRAVAFHKQRVIRYQSQPSSGLLLLRRPSNQLD
jgi:hypothetical protein